MDRRNCIEGTSGHKWASSWKTTKNSRQAWRIKQEILIVAIAMCYSCIIFKVLFLNCIHLKETFHQTEVNVTNSNLFSKFLRHLTKFFVIITSIESWRHKRLGNEVNLVSTGETVKYSQRRTDSLHRESCCVLSPHSSSCLSSARPGLS